MTAPRPLALVIFGAASSLIALVITVLQPSALAGWLAAFAFWSSVPIGALLLTMMIRLIPGIWGELLGEPAEDALFLLPLVLLAVLPILIGSSAIYGWASTSSGSGFRGIYLSQVFFAARTIGFLVAAILLAVLLITRRPWSIALSSIGLIAFVPFHTMLAVDWLASLDPDFHASGFGLYVLSIQAVVALSILILVRLAAGDPGPATGILGGLLLTSLLLWAYFVFMQYFISWSNNLPPIVEWYQRRGAGFWSAVEWLIALLGLLPAFLLLFPPIRTSARFLQFLCIVTLVGKALELAWLSIPGSHAPVLSMLVAILGLAGLGVLTLAALASSKRLARRRNLASRQRATS